MRFRSFFSGGLNMTGPNRFPVFFSPYPLLMNGRQTSSCPPPNAKSALGWPLSDFSVRFCRMLEAFGD